MVSGRSWVTGESAGRGRGEGGGGGVTILLGHSAARLILASPPRNLFASQKVGQVGLA